MAQQDAVVIERRLRPIYDSFEVGNFKKALHETEKVLKKTPNLRCARALKGLALVRMGKNDESDSIINQVVSEKPTDDSTLQVLSFIFKELEQYSNICTIYQNAVEKDGGNEELLTQLFMSYTRMNDYAAQQKTAMQLYKLKQKNPYYCWAVMSLLLKAIHGADKDDPIKRKISLELAQRMMEKLINDEKLDAEQEAQLYLIILDKQNKYAEQLEFLDSETGKKIYPGAPVEMKIKLLKHLKQWPKLNAILKELLREHIDRWDWYQDYIQTVVQLVNNNAGDEINGEKPTDNTFELCQEFLCELIESSKKKYRGPYLARLELYRVMKQNKFDAKSLFGEFIEMLFDYFQVFGEKPCCAKDIVLFLDDLEDDQKPELASKLIRLCNISATTLPRTKEQMQRHICSLQVSRICGAHLLSVEHLSALYTAFTLHYEHGLNAFGIDMLPTDIGLSDSYALLAVHVMYDLAMKLKSSDHMVEALCLLNYLLSNSPSNFHAKLLCLQMYHRIGCVWGAHNTYNNLSLKFIQLHSMGYLHCARLATSGLFTVAREVYDPTLRFYNNFMKEGHEFISMCYKFGSFSKLQEFMDFHYALTHSYHHMLTSWDAILLEITCFGSSTNSTHDQILNAFKFLQIDATPDTYDYNKLNDNRDLSVIERWDPKSNDKQIQKQYNDAIYQQDLDLLRIRSNFVRMIVLCVETATKEKYGKFKQTDQTSSKCDQLELHVKNWMEMFRKIRTSNHAIASNEFLVNQLPSRLHDQLRMPYESLFRNIAELILSIEQRLTEPIEHIQKRLEHDIEELNGFLCKTIEEYNGNEDRLWNRRIVQDTIGIGTEILAVATFLMSIIHEKYLSTASNKPPKRNKKKTTNAESSDSTIYVPTDKERVTVISAVVNRLKIELNTFDAAIESWKMPRLPKTLTETLASLSLNPKVETLVETTISKNHELTVMEIRNVLKDKLRMLNTLSKINV